MRRKAPTRRRARAIASLTLLLLASVTGIAFEGGRRAGPPSTAQDQAAAAAAVRMTLERAPVQFPVSAARASVPLVAGADHVADAREATHVRIARIGIDADVRTVGYSFRQGRLEYDIPMVEAGHYAGTAAPGEPGNAVIAGHVANRGAVAVFRRLPEVAIGDVVEVSRGEEVYRYAVTELRVVPPEATGVMAPTTDARLTLITCSPDDQHRDRLVVLGKLL